MRIVSTLDSVPDCVGSSSVTNPIGCVGVSTVGAAPLEPVPKVATGALKAESLVRNVLFTRFVCDCVGATLVVAHLSLGSETGSSVAAQATFKMDALL